MLLAIGVIATMLVLGMFAADRVQAAAPVTTAITATPSDPGDATTIKITFTTDEIIQGNSGEIWIRFDKGFTVPSTISKNLMTITTSQSTGGTSNPLIDPTIEVKSSSNVSTLLNDTIVKVTVGDTVPSSTASVEDIHIGSGHIITIASSAGIKLPTGSSTTGNIIRMSIDSGTTYAVAEATAGVAGVTAITTQRTLTLSATSGARGTDVTATGSGFSSTGSLTVWIDDGDDTLETGEYIIESGVAVSGGAFEVTFTTDTNFTGAQVINAVDGGGTAATANIPTFTTIGKVTTDKATAARGATVKVSLAQYATGGALTYIKIGGVQATLPSDSTIAAGVGEGFEITVPTTTPLGTQQVVVSGGGEANRSTTIEITGAPLTVSPATAVPLQEVTVSGSGFSGSAKITAITVAGADVTMVGTATLNASASTDVTTDNSGNMVASFKVPNNSTTRTAADHKVQVTDANGRIGEFDLTIPGRTLVLSTDSSKRGSTVDSSGDGFVAKSTITIKYTSGGTDTTVGTATADSAGAWSVSFTVPETAGIPSTNVVTATSSDSGSKTATHKLPGASIVIDPGTTESGKSITITGTDFPKFVSVTTLDIGGISAMPSPAPATGADGNFTATVLVPGLAAGTHSTLVTAGGISANLALTVQAAAAVTVSTTNATEVVFADVIANDDNLVRVWRFNNADQSWAFYDPRAAFSSANTLIDATSGDIVWVNVNTDEEFQGQTLYSGWNLISLD